VSSKVCYSPVGRGAAAGKGWCEAREEPCIGAGKCVPLNSSSVPFLSRDPISSANALLITAGALSSPVASLPSLFTGYLSVLLLSCHSCNERKPQLSFNTHYHHQHALTPLFARQPSRRQLASNKTRLQSHSITTITLMASNSTPAAARKTGVPEKKYKCQFCNRAFSRSEHRSRHERSRKCISRFRDGA
jgi:uncharacterized Zn-finger protein